MPTVSAPPLRSLSSRGSGGNVGICLCWLAALFVLVIVCKVGGEALLQAIGAYKCLLILSASSDYTLDLAATVGSRVFMFRRARLPLRIFHEAKEGKYKFKWVFSLLYEVEALNTVARLVASFTEDLINCVRASSNSGYTARSQNV